MKRMILFLFWLIPVVFLSTDSVALAQTPDGEPPSVETVCDDQVGAAFGLCNAYCEAMDCDSVDPQASPTACDKVAAKFMNITGSMPPCLVPPGPMCDNLATCTGCDTPGDLDLCCADSPDAEICGGGD
jgi:hypothetical protein